MDRLLLPHNSKFMAFFSLSWWLLLHPFFVSVAEINHNAAEKSLEISVRVFTDDFENALVAKFPGKKIDLYKAGENITTDSLMARYLREKLSIKVNGLDVKSAYIGHQLENESVWCFLEVPNVPIVKTLVVHDRMLYEYKKEQINMIHVKAGGKQQSYKLDNPAFEASFTF